MTQDASTDDAVSLEDLVAAVLYDEGEREPSTEAMAAAVVALCREWFSNEILAARPAWCDSHAPAAASFWRGTVNRTLEEAARITRSATCHRQ